MRSPTPKYSFHKWCNDHGGALVEFAIVMPLLLLLCFGIIEFGFVFYNKAVLTNASREGARVGIHYETTTGEYTPLSTIQNVIFAYCKDRLIPKTNQLVSEDINVSWNGSGTQPSVPSTGLPLTVTIDYNYNFFAFSGVISLFGGSMKSISLGAKTVMLLE